MNLSIESTIKYIENNLPEILRSILVFIIGWYAVNILIHILKNLLTKSRIENIVVTFLCSVANIALKIVIIITTLASMGLNTTSFVTVLATLGAAFVLGLKDSLTDVASGIIILIVKPFKQGDYVKISEQEGYVTKIEIMSTYLETLMKELVIIPNSQVQASTIYNYSKEAVRRFQIDVLVDYKTDFNVLKQVVTEVLEASTLVHHASGYDIAISDLADSGMKVRIRGYATLENYFLAKDRTRIAIKEAFDRNQIVIPYNKLDINITSEHQ